MGLAKSMAMSEFFINPDDSEKYIIKKKSGGGGGKGVPIFNTGNYLYKQYNRDYYRINRKIDKDIMDSALKIPLVQGTKFAISYDEGKIFSLDFRGARQEYVYVSRMTNVYISYYDEYQKRQITTSTNIDFPKGAEVGYLVALRIDKSETKDASKYAANFVWGSIYWGLSVHIIDGIEDVIATFPNAMYLWEERYGGRMDAQGLIYDSAVKGNVIPFEYI